MINEVLFAIVVLISLLTVLLFARLGKEWLMITPVILLVLANIFAPQLCTVFGITTSLALPIYAAIFLSTDIIAEHFGKKTARKMVWLGFASQVLMLVFSQIIIKVNVIEFSQQINQALQTIFSFTPRLVMGSMIAYLISQHYDVWIFHLLKNKFKGKHIWLRNNFSTTTSQVLDTSIFVIIAFYGVIPNFLELLIGACFLKIIIAFIDTPFIYLSYNVIRKPIRRLKLSAVT